MLCGAILADTQRTSCQTSFKMKIRFDYSLGCRRELHGDIVLEGRPTMLVRNNIFIASALFSCLCSWNGQADNLPPDQSPIAVLTATLAMMNLSNPIADLEANAAKGDRRFIGINGYA